MIRKMTFADLADVEKLEKASFTHPWPSGSFEYELRSNAYSTCLVAEDFETKEKPQLVGVLVAWQIVDSLEIGTISVAESYRHLGIGRNMLAHALLKASEKGVVESLLEVRASNQPAIKLYLGLGFEVVGLRPGYYEDNNEDALLLKLYRINPEQLRNLITMNYV